MPTFKVYQQHGIRFEYPTDWEVSEQVQGEELLITINSPGTSFWTVGLFGDRPGPAAVIESAMQAFEDDYPQLDAYPVEQQFRGQPLVGMDLEFFCLELLNTAQLRAFDARDFTVLSLAQADDTEWDTSEPLFESMLASVECEFPDWHSEWRLPLSEAQGDEDLPDEGGHPR